MPASQASEQPGAEAIWAKRPALILFVPVALFSMAWASFHFWPSAAPTADDSGRLVSRADDYYFQFSRADNESAIELYQRVLTLHPEDATALAGLANALTQRSIRWPRLPDDEHKEFTRLGDALANGHLDREPARQQLLRAHQLAERAVAVAPDSAAAHKAMGFVLSAQRQTALALLSYERAISLDPDAWGPMINIGDLLEISGRGSEALPWFEQAYDAMGRAYDRNPVQIRPWHADLGVLIAERYHARGDMLSSETWYRRVLAGSPFNQAATIGFSRLLREGGDQAAADRLCNELEQRMGKYIACH